MPHKDLSNEQLLLAINRVDGLDALKALDGMSGQTSLYLKLVKNFAQDQHGRADELQALFQAKDWEVLKRRCHSLKSYSAYVGAYELNHLCADAEAKLNKGSVDQSVIEAICRLLDPLVEKLRQIVIDNETPSAKAEFNLLQFKKDLIALLPLLEQSDFGAEEALQKLMQITEGRDHHHTLQQIYSYVDDVEYEIAVEETRKLLESLV